MTNASNRSLFALAALMVSVFALQVGHAEVGQPRTDQRGQVLGPSGGYNQRDLEVARPFGQRCRDEVARALTGWTVPQTQEAAQMGAFIEFAKPLGDPTVDQYAEGIREVGPQFCIVSQTGVSHLPPEFVGAFVVALRERGFAGRELDVMMKDNPARLLGLPAP